MFWIKFANELTLLIPVEITVGISLLFFRTGKYEGFSQLIIAYLGIALLVDLSSRWAGWLFHDNLIVVPVYALLELGLLSLIYFRFMLHKRLFGLMALAALAAIFICIEIYYLSAAKVASFQSYSRTCCSFILVIYALSYLFENLGIKTEQPIKMKLNTVFLLYFACNFFIYLPINFFINAATETKYILWTFNLMLVFCYYLALFRLTWQSGNSQTPSSSGYSSP